MDDKKQNIDSKEHLLDALDASENTDEDLKELLSDPDNIQDIRLLQDCRKCFIREDSSLGGEPEVAWEKFLRKQKKNSKRKAGYARRQIDYQRIQRPFQGCRWLKATG